MRRPIIAANWKMYKTRAEAREFVAAFKSRVSELSDIDVVIAPPFTALADVASEISGDSISLAAQNMNSKSEGAFTGEISPTMLKDAGCKYVILGHSERRQHFGEGDELIGLKVSAALGAGLTPIVCVGETINERKSDETEGVIIRQLRAALSEAVVSRSEQLVVAYEPVWAIGTGETASANDAQMGADLIRRELAHILNDEVADGIRIQYGGSVKPGNAQELLSLSDVDGALVGGASLDSESFAQIVNAVSGDR